MSATAPLRVLIVDDEPLARRGMRQLLERGGDTDLLVVGECADGRAAVDAIAATRPPPDLVLLDVQMPEMDGFEVLRAVGPERMPCVVFVTAHDRFAVDAFEVNAVDYLLKPFDDERFARAIARAKRAVRGAEVGELSRRLIGLLEHTAEARRPGALTRLVVREDGRTFFLRAEEIDWIEAADYVARVHAHGKVHVLRETMATLESRLDPARFFRVHRSAIVNLDRIRELQPYFHGESVVILQDGTQLKLSRTRRDKLETLLGQSL